MTSNLAQLTVNITRQMSLGDLVSSKDGFKYRLDKTIGEGSYGKVKLGIDTVTNEKVAVKVLEKANIRSEKQVARIQREIKFLRLLHHPNIIKVIELQETPDKILIAMEYATNGELFDYIVTHKKIKEKEARHFFRQILSAVEYCHLNGVIHRDLKAENILLDNDKNVKIIDFGFGNTYKTNGLLDTYCGSPFYAAPSMLLGQKYHGPETDMWSLGVILFAMLAGHLPFDDDNMKELYRKIASAIYVMPDDMPEDCKHLITRMICVDPAKRAKLNEIKVHPWISEGYDGPPSSHLPDRKLKGIEFIDMDVVDKMASFGYEEPEVLKALSAHLSKTHHSMDPVVCTYFLVKEMMERELQEKYQVEVQPIMPSTKTLLVSSSPVVENKFEHKTASANDLLAIRTPALSLKATGSNKLQLRTTSIDAASTPLKSKRAHFNDVPFIIETAPMSAPIKTKFNPLRLDVTTKKSIPGMMSASVTTSWKDKIATLLDSDSKSARSRQNSSDSSSQAKKNDDIRSINGWFVTARTSSTKQPENFMADILAALKMLSLKGFTFDRDPSFSPWIVTVVQVVEDVIFQIEVCKIPRLKMHGVVFKRISGNMKSYKQATDIVIDALKL